MLRYVHEGQKVRITHKEKQCNNSLSAGRSVQIYLQITTGHKNIEIWNATTSYPTIIEPDLVLRVFKNIENLFTSVDFVI